MKRPFLQERRRLVPTSRAGLARAALVSALVILVSAAGPTGASASDEATDARLSDYSEQASLAWEEELLIEAAVLAHIHDEMWWRGGVFELSQLGERQLVPIWVERPIHPFGPDRFEVSVELMAVRLPPTDYPTIEEASSHPGMVPRTAEQAVARRAETRGPKSWQVTFDVRRIGEGVYRVEDARVTGRPGEPRRPLIVEGE